MHTSIGKLLQCTDGIKYSVYDNVNGDDGLAEASRRDTRRIVSNVPHYVADAKIMRLAEGSAAHNTMAAMARAGIRKLPFDPIMIEMTAPPNEAGKVVHSFVRLQTHPFDGLDAHGTYTDHDEPIKIDVYAYIVQFQQHPQDPDNILIASLPAYAPVGIQFQDGSDAKKPYTVLVQHRILDNKDTDGYAKMEYEMHLVIAEAMAIAMLMLNTRGIEKLQVDTTKLNKARAKSSTRDNPKPPIGAYTVLRIGHIYDSSGRAHSVEGSGRHMPVHWRAGHTRMVPYGPMNAEVRPTRMKFIPPCLVNFDPLEDAAVPMPKREVTV